MSDASKASYLQGTDILIAEALRGVKVKGKAVPAAAKAAVKTEEAPPAVKESEQETAAPLIPDLLPEDAITPPASEADVDWGDSASRDTLPEEFIPPPPLDSYGEPPIAPPSVPPAPSTPSEPEPETSQNEPGKTVIRKPTNPGEGQRAVVTKPAPAQRTVVPRKVKKEEESPQQRGAAFVPPKSPAGLSAPRREVPVVRVKGDDRCLQSEIEGVSDEAWTAFSYAMKVAGLSNVSASNAMGMFALKPRRLADLGLMTSVACRRSPMGRFVWVGEFKAPLTAKLFLSDAALQYKAFGDSMKDYVNRLRDGTIPKPTNGPSEGMTLSGVLAILHRCGPHGLANWNTNAPRFSDTVELYNRANGIF